MPLPPEVIAKIRSGAAATAKLLADADEIVREAELAGIDVTRSKVQLDELRQKLIKINAVYGS